MYPYKLNSTVADYVLNMETDAPNPVVRTIQKDREKKETSRYA